MNKIGWRAVLLFDRLPLQASLARHRYDGREAWVGQFDGMMEWVMKIVTKTLLAAALMMGLTGMACAQSANLSANGMVGLQAGGMNGTGQGTGLGAGAAGLSPTPGGGTVGHAPMIGGTGGTGSGPALNNMRANGTSLNMSPDPRAPNVTGKAFGQ